MTASTAAGYNSVMGSCQTCLCSRHWLGGNWQESCSTGKGLVTKSKSQGLGLKLQEVSLAT